MDNADLPNTIQTSLRQFRRHVTDYPGDMPLYRQFDYILNDISTARKAGFPLDEKTAGEILETVKLLVTENAKGRRPWIGSWEFYFEKCMENALRLIREFCFFQEHETYLPKGYCLQFLNSFHAMDRFAKEYATKHWYTHFLNLAVISAEMFSLTADETANIDEKALETPDNHIFAFLLTGFAKTGKAKELLLRYCNDDKAWVRDLALLVLQRYYE